MKECTDSATKFLLAAGLLLAAKAVLALLLAPFGDEAFSWWESRHLAVGYTDVPPLLPWLIRLGTTIAGDNALGLRLSALAIGSATPWLVYLWARRFHDRGRAIACAGLALCIPLAAMLGVLALPDVPLTAAMLGATLALDRAAARDAWRDWLLLGACLALGWMSHYRFVMFYLAGAAFVLLTTNGRALLARPRFWIAHLVGAAGLLPVLWFNYVSGWAALRFQFVERHPWAFHADALGEVFVQLVVTTPLMFALLVAGVARQRRAALLVSASSALLIGYLVLDCFADATRVRFHWPLPAYLIALPALPALIDDWRARGGWRKVFAMGAPLLGFSGTALALLWLSNAVGSRAGIAARLVPDNLAGWDEIAAFAERERVAVGPDAIAIAGDFLTGAEWAWQRRASSEPFVLDHPLNVKHGRAGQLAIWGRDEAGLRAASWSNGLLLVDDTAGHEAQTLPMYRSLCTRFGSVDFRRELKLRDGQIRVLAFAVTRGRDSDASGRCALPPLAYVDAPASGARIEGPTADVSGWAIAEFIGVAKVELLVDGEVDGAATYGVDMPKVRGQWPMSADPNQPRVGFAGTLKLDKLARGEHSLAVRVTDRDGRVRDTVAQKFELQQ